MVGTFLADSYNLVIRISLLSLTDYTRTSSQGTWYYLKVLVVYIVTYLLI